MKPRNNVRSAKFMSNVVVPNDLAVRCVQKGNSKPSIVERALRDSLAVPLSLRENALRSKRNLFCLDNTDDRAIHAEGIVRRAVGGLELSDSAVLAGIQRHARSERNDIPPCCLQLWVDQALAS